MAEMRVSYAPPTGYPLGTNPTYKFGAGVLIPLISLITKRTWTGAENIPKTGAAIIGTLSGSVIAVVGALWSTDALRLTGITGDEDLILAAIASQVKLSNLLIASMVIAGFGALNDVTVTQSSAVWELASASEKQNWRQLFVGGMRIGRDHIASSIYTIAFAYVGSALVTLMLIVAASPPLSRLINDEVVAQELALIMIGSIALALSTPITTAVAAWFAVRITKVPAAN